MSYTIEPTKTKKEKKKMKNLLEKAKEFLNLDPKEEVKPEESKFDQEKMDKLTRMLERSTTFKYGTSRPTFAMIKQYNDTHNRPKGEVLKQVTANMEVLEEHPGRQLIKRYEKKVHKNGKFTIKKVIELI